MGKVALVAGHNKYTGARAYDNTDEWLWNMKLLELISAELVKLGHVVYTLTRNPNVGYTSAMRELARDMKFYGVDAACELHFNSASRTSRGHEYLHWWGSRKSKRLALSVAKEHQKDFPNSLARGSKGTRTTWFHRWNRKKAYTGNAVSYTHLTLPTKA